MSDREGGQRFGALREAWAQLSSEQQMGIMIFSICGGLTLLFSGWYLRAQIRAPFMTPLSSLQASRKFVDERTKALQAEEDQKMKDTDGDGISDWDELNVYHTSPYLDDSDSDGVSDGAEIAQGTDPNCPKGRECQLRLDGVAQRSSTSSVQGLLEGIGSASPTLPAPAPGKALTPDEIRSFITSNHLATEAEVKGLSDQSLTALYQRAMGGSATPPASVPATPPAPATNAIPSSP
jgi:hypothetical protein